MAVVLLLAISCSKKDNQVTAKANPSAAPATASPAAALASVTTEAPKKIKKHRPTTATYVNSVYGLSFSYPRKYSLQASKNETATNRESAFVKPGSLEIVRVDVPSDAYPDTDFSSGLLAVRLNPSLSAEECLEFNSKPLEPTKPASVKLGNNEFAEREEIKAEGLGESDLKYFHIFKNQACYEFALAVETSRSADEDLAQVDRGKVFQQLEKILTSARIKNAGLAAGQAEETGAAKMTTAQRVTEKAEVIATEQK
ncbi:MAG: hypothetical protein JO356_00285 [Acidobacteria bacterium]|nr:hypothetical protein [Acidobacteriota bacterium]